MIKRHLAGLVVAAVVAGGGAAAWASAPDSTPAQPSTAAAGKPSPAAAPNAKGKRARGGAMVRRTVHGDLIVRGKDGFQNVTLDRGTVQSKGSDSITLKRPDGPVVTIKVDGSTRYRGVDSLAAVETGKPAVIVSKAGVAVTVAQKAPGGNNANRGNVGADEEQVPAT
jgi:hypothetical protein